MKDNAARDTPSDRVGDAIAKTSVDVLLPAHGKPRVTDKPTLSGNPAMDAALKDPVAQKGIASAMGASFAVGATGGFVSGLALGGVAGAGIIGLTWALWPKKKR